MHLVRRKACCVHGSLVTFQLPQERLLLRIEYLQGFIASSSAAMGMLDLGILLIPTASHCDARSSQGGLE